MMLLHSQSISYFNVKHTIWLKGYHNSNNIELSEQWLQAAVYSHCSDSSVWLPFW